MAHAEYGGKNSRSHYNKILTHFQQHGETRLVI